MTRRTRRISLGMKQTQPNPWETLRERYHVGDRVSGRVRNLTDFGAFVELTEGFKCLCHVLELPDERVECPKDTVQIEQKMQFRILRIEPQSKKIGLSARAAKSDELIVDVKSYTTFN